MMIRGRKVSKLSETERCLNVSSENYHHCLALRPTSMKMQRTDKSRPRPRSSRTRTSKTTINKKINDNVNEIHNRDCDETAPSDNVPEAEAEHIKSKVKTTKAPNDQREGDSKPTATEHQRWKSRKDHLLAYGRKCDDETVHIPIQHEVKRLRSSSSLECVKSVKNTTDKQYVMGAYAEAGSITQHTSPVTSRFKRACEVPDSPCGLMIVENSPAWVRGCRHAKSSAKRQMQTSPSCQMQTRRKRLKMMEKSKMPRKNPSNSLARSKPSIETKKKMSQKTIGTQTNSFDDQQSINNMNVKLTSNSVQESSDGLDAGPGSLLQKMTMLNPVVPFPAILYDTSSNACKDESTVPVRQKQLRKTLGAKKSRAGNQASRSKSYDVAMTVSETAAREASKAFAGMVTVPHNQTFQSDTLQNNVSASIATCALPKLTSSAATTTVPQVLTSGIPFDSSTGFSLQTESTNDKRQSSTTAFSTSEESPPCDGCENVPTAPKSAEENEKNSKANEKVAEYLSISQTSQSVAHGSNTPWPPVTRVTVARAPTVIPVPVTSTVTVEGIPQGAVGTPIVNQNMFQNWLNCSLNHLLTTASSTTEMPTTTTTISPPKERAITPKLAQLPSSEDSAAGRSMVTTHNKEIKEVKDSQMENGEKIKRPMNAFMIWSREQRAKLLRQVPKMTNSEISVKLGHMWNDLDYDVKQVFFDEANRLKADHKKQHPDWVYQPRPNKRRHRRPKKIIRHFTDPEEQCSQLLLLLPDGKCVVCPAIQAGQAQASVQQQERMLLNPMSSMNGPHISNTAIATQCPQQTLGPDALQSAQQTQQNHNGCVYLDPLPVYPTPSVAPSRGNMPANHGPVTQGHPSVAFGTNEKDTKSALPSKDIPNVTVLPLQAKATSVCTPLVQQSHLAKVEGPMNVVVVNSFGTQPVQLMRNEAQNIVNLQVPKTVDKDHNKPAQVVFPLTKEKQCITLPFSFGSSQVTHPQALSTTIAQQGNLSAAPVPVSIIDGKGEIIDLAPSSSLTANLGMVANATQDVRMVSANTSALKTSNICKASSEDGQVVKSKEEIGHMHGNESISTADGGYTNVALPKGKPDGVQTPSGQDFLSPNKLLASLAWSGVDVCPSEASEKLFDRVMSIKTDLTL